jgi:hypothetical protein
MDWRRRAGMGVDMEVRIVRGQGELRVNDILFTVI